VKKDVPEFIYPQDGGESQLALKLRHCHPKHDVDILRQSCTPDTASPLVYLSGYAGSMLLAACGCGRGFTWIAPAHTCSEYDRQQQQQQQGKTRTCTS